MLKTSYSLGIIEKKWGRAASSHFATFHLSYKLISKRLETDLFLNRVIYSHTEYLSNRWCIFLASRAGWFFQSKNFENGILSKYVTFDVESKSDIYFDIKQVLPAGFSFENPIFFQKWVILPRNRQYLKNCNSSGQIRKRHWNALNSSSNDVLRLEVSRITNQDLTDPDLVLILMSSSS